MRIDLFIDGESVARPTFQARSAYYDGYSWEVSNASTLDIAKAIGAAQRAPRPSLFERAGILEKACSLVTIPESHLEHTVRTTGMPISVLRKYVSEIPKIFRNILGLQNGRAPNVMYGLPAQHLSSGVDMARIAEDGYCYVVTPGNDPRVAAVCAANLVFMGIPFVIKGSREDACGPLAIRALVEAGMPPQFGSMVYFDIDQPDAKKKHFKLVDSSSMVWVFGSDETVDRALRLEEVEPRVVLDVTELAKEGASPKELAKLLKARLEAGTLPLTTEKVVNDHFQGKIVLRHGSGNCAAIVKGGLTSEMAQTLYASIRYAIGCNSTKSAVVVDGPGFVSDAKRYLSSLVVGDPLREDTQIGYAEPGRLAVLDDLIARHKSKVVVHGGEVVSPHQRRPVLLELLEPVPEILSTEISVYTLAVAQAKSVNQAVTILNDAMNGVARLGVALLGLSPEETSAAATAIRSHAVVIDGASSTIVCTCHEGNDYMMRLTRPKLLIKRGQGTATA